MIGRRLGASAAGLLGLALALAWVATALDARNASAYHLPAMLEGLDHVQRQSGNRAALGEQLGQLEAMLGAMSERVPSRLDAAALERDVRQSATAAGLELSLADAREQETKEFYAVLPFELRVRGANDAVYAFLAQLANGGSLRRVAALRIVPSDEGRQALVAHVMLELYRYRDDDELDNEPAR